MVKPKVILEMANNHMGDYDHGIIMIDKFADQVKFAADYSSKRDIDDIILSLLPSIINNIDSIIERRSTNVES